MSCFCVSLMPITCVGPALCVQIYFLRLIVNECNGPLARYVILRVAHAPGMPGTFYPPPRFSDPDMHHGTCVTHVPWCMSGSLTSSFLWSRPRGKTFPAFPAHAQPAILRIWQEAHVETLRNKCKIHQECNLAFGVMFHDWQNCQISYSYYHRRLWLSRCSALDLSKQRLDL